MTYGVSGIKPPGNGNGIQVLELTYYDTEEIARTEAENWLHKGFKDVTVWKQIGVPKLETKVSWEDSSCVE